MVTECNGVLVFGDPEEGALEQAQNCLRSGAEKVCLMADNHKGYSVPIGGVVVYKDAICPQGVGYDIGCGNKAVLTDLRMEDIVNDIPKIMDEVYSKISFGVGRGRVRDDFQSPHDDPVFDRSEWYNLPNSLMLDNIKTKARNQLGTVGSGNHYVDIFTDELSRIWIGVHFGSRGLGHTLATHFLNASGAGNGMDTDPVLIKKGTSLFDDYWSAMELAGAYAYAGRDWVCDRVLHILGGKALFTVHNHHNFAWEENHFGEDLIVVRKGATPAFPGQMGFVGGSMGDISVILQGVDSEKSKNALYSTVHGAGRVMSRTQAAGKKRWIRNPETGKKAILKAGDGLISRQMMEDWISPMNVELRGAGTDESPHCYKRLPDVLKAHVGTISVAHTLRPLGVAMAGENEFDPYKD